MVFEDIAIGEMQCSLARYATNALLPDVTPSQPSDRRIVQNPTVSMLAVSLNQTNDKRTKRGEEPSVLSRCVPLLQCLLDSLLRVLSLRHLLESIRSHNTLQSLQLECVSCWHQVVVVDDLDEWLDLGSLLLTGLRHATGDLRWVTLDTGDQCVRVWVALGSRVLGLDQDDLQRFASALLPSISPYARNPHGGRIYLLAGISSPGDDGNTANFEDCKYTQSVFGHCSSMRHSCDSHFMATCRWCCVVVVVKFGVEFEN